MESVQHLKKRLKSVKNINQVTKTMELVAAIKMRKAQEVALASRPYAFAALDLLAAISAQHDDLPDLLKRRKEIKKTLFILVASDKGLAGAFNSSVFKSFEQYLANHATTGEKVFLAIGEKSARYLVRKKLPSLKTFLQAGDFVSPDQIRPIATFVISGYLKNEFDEVIVFSNHFKSALKQQTLVRTVLPVDAGLLSQTVKEIIPETGRFSQIIKEQNLHFADSKSNSQYLIEPSAESVLSLLAKHLLVMETYHVILEANAAEHSARRLAMKTASDNAEDLSGKLALQYNKSRQAGITNQIIEITAASEALS